jgi:hypothetical protein
VSLADHWRCPLGQSGRHRLHAGLGSNPVTYRSVALRPHPCIRQGHFHSTPCGHNSPAYSRFPATSDPGPAGKNRLLHSEMPARQNQQTPSPPSRQCFQGHRIADRDRIVLTPQRHGDTFGRWSVPGGPLAAPFRVFGRVPASCRVGEQSRDLSVHGPSTRARVSARDIFILPHADTIPPGIVVFQQPRTQARPARIASTIPGRRYGKNRRTIPGRPTCVSRANGQRFGIGSS